MRKTALVAVGLVLLAGGMNAASSQQVTPEGAGVGTLPAAQQTGEKTFADIPWGAGLPTIEAALAEKGFGFVETDQDGDHVFDGELLGYPARVFAFMAGDGVVRLQVVIGTPDEDAIGTFEMMKEVFTSQYGAPIAEQEVYEDPYRKGDGREAEAIKAGKGMLAVSYDGLWMEVGEDLIVFVNYESAAWEAELERRRLAETRKIFTPGA